MGLLLGFDACQNINNFYDHKVKYYYIRARLFLSDLLVEGGEYPGAVVEPGEGLDQAVGESRLAHGPVTLKISTNQRPVLWQSLYERPVFS